MSARGAVRLRRARVADARDLARLSGDLGYPADPGVVAGRLRDLAGRPDEAVWVAVDRDGRVLGWIHAFVARRVESDPFVELGGLVVDPGARRRGVGGSLVAGARRWAAGRGVGEVRVRSRVERDDARAFYGALGFRVSKTQRVFAGPVRG